MYTSRHTCPCTRLDICLYTCLHAGRRWGLVGRSDCSHAPAGVHMSMYMSIHNLFMHMSMHTVMHMSMHMLIYISIHISIYMNIHMSWHTSIQMTMHMPMPMSPHIPMHMSVHMSAHMSVHMSAHMSYVHVCTPGCSDVKTNIERHACARVYPYQYICLPTCLCTRRYDTMLIHVCKHAYKHICTHLNTQVRVWTYLEAAHGHSTTLVVTTHGRHSHRHVRPNIQRHFSFQTCLWPVNVCV